MEEVNMIDHTSLLASPNDSLRSRLKIQPRSTQKNHVDSAGHKSLILKESKIDPATSMEVCLLQRSSPHAPTLLLLLTEEEGARSC